MDTDMVLDCSSGPDASVAPGGTQVTQIGMAPVVAWPSGTNMAHVAAQTLSILRAFGDDGSHRHQHRPRLRQGHRPRHGLWQQLRPGCHHDPQWHAGLPHQPILCCFPLFRSASLHKVCTILPPPALPHPPHINSPYWYLAAQWVSFIHRVLMAPGRPVVSPPHDPRQACDVLHPLGSDLILLSYKNPGVASPTMG